MNDKKINHPASLPGFLGKFLWSYSLSKLDPVKDFKRIATNILNYGDLEAVDWLFDHYEMNQIKTILTEPLKGEWDPKSLTFWSKFFEVTPDSKKALKNFVNG